MFEHRPTCIKARLEVYVFIPHYYDQEMSSSLHDVVIDESTMSVDDFQAARMRHVSMQRSDSIVSISSATTSDSPIEISSDDSSASSTSLSSSTSTPPRSFADTCTCSWHRTLRRMSTNGDTQQAQAQSPQASSSIVTFPVSSPKVPWDMSTSFTTPERRPRTPPTDAPKFTLKPIVGGNYSKWSMKRLSEAFLTRLQPMSQKRTLDRQYMIDALVQHDAECAAQYPLSSPDETTASKAKRACF